MDSFLSPTLSLPTQLEMEVDRRRAARMSRDQLAGRMDEMIQAWYMQQAMINGMLGAIRQLQVQVVLAGAPTPTPGRSEPAPHHFQWARELLGQR